LEEEKATLEAMVESRDELLMEIAREMGLEGPEKATRGGVNGSQSKFLCKN
jgi:hypothetical protein